VGVFGQFSIFATIVYLGNVFTTYGVDVLLIRETAREGRVTSLASTALWLQVFLSLFWCAIFLIGSVPFLTPDLTATLFVYNLSLLPLALYTVFSSLLRAFERMDLFMGLNLCSSLLQVAGVLALVKTPDDLRILCIWLVIAQVLTALIGAGLCRKTIPSFSIQMKPVLGDILELFRSGWRVALFAPLSLLSQRLSLFMLSSLSGAVATGLFSASARLVEGLKLGHFAVTNSLMPSMSRPTSPQQQRLYRFSLHGLLWMSVALAIIVTFTADIIIKLIYGPAFEQSIGLLKIIVWVLVPYTFSVYYSLTLVMRGAESLVLRANVIGLIAAVVFYLLLIPLFGVPGAAWGTLATETLQAAILLFARHSKSDSEAHAARLI
jgi:O-antigen/teichoic acid export membrane protein